jgi:formylglycine-generating enzyme required for sulfatase activity
MAAERQAATAADWSKQCATAAARSSALSTADQAKVEALTADAEAFAAAGQWPAASDNYRKARRIDPANIDVMFALGECLRHMGDLAGAAECFSSAASFPRVGANNAYFRSMMALQDLPPMADRRLTQPTVIFRVEDAPSELWDAPYAPHMTVIPGGEFTMGSLHDEPDRGPAETPHRVTLAYPLAVGTCDVARGEFAAFVEDTGYDAESHGDVFVFRGGAFEVDPTASWRNPGFDQRDDEPVTCVNYYDGVAYARWLTQKTGALYRLPSEAEWEYAVRAGTSSSYYWGETLGLGNANCDGCTAGPPSLRTTPGGSFPPNGFGLYDVVGNVWKWLEDSWNPTYVGAPTDGSAWRAGTSVLRGRRGGSWFNVHERRPGDVRAPHRLRSAARFGSLPGLRFSSFGLRLVRDV